ncbi:MAG: MBL fold metallo-hydrolase [Acidimicrobiia bacterium]
MTQPEPLAPLPLVTTYDAVAGVPWVYDDLVTCVVAPNPGPFTFLGTNTYVIGRDVLALIDPGPDDEAHHASLLAAIDGRAVSHVFVTHTHRDHSPLATKMARELDAELVGCGPHPEPRFRPPVEPTPDPTNEEDSDTAPEKGEGGDREYRPDRQLLHGDRVVGDGWTVEALHTPGHISNHLCYALVGRDLVFTGDHIMGWSTSVISPAEGDLGDFLRSCELLLSRSERTYLSAHGAPITDPHALVRAFMDHRRGRSQQILTVLRERDGDLLDLGDFVTAMYPGLDERLVKAAKGSVLAHLIDLRSNGFIEIVGALGTDATFRRTDWC